MRTSDHAALILAVIAACLGAGCPEDSPAIERGSPPVELCVRGWCFEEPPLGMATSVWSSGQGEVWLTGQEPSSENRWVALIEDDRVATTREGRYLSVLGGSGPRDVWVQEGMPPSLLHFDGSGWSSVATGSISHFASLGPDDAAWWAAGGLVRWTRGTSTTLDSPVPAGAVGPQVAPLSARDGALWVVARWQTRAGSDASTPDAGFLGFESHVRLLERRDAVWLEHDLPPGPDCAPMVRFSDDDLWAQCAHDVWRYTDTWRPAGAGPARLLAAPGAGPGHELWAHTGDGLSRWDGTGWSRTLSGESVTSLASTGPGAAWAVRSNGDVLLYGASRWREISSRDPTRPGFFRDTAGMITTPASSRWCSWTERNDSDDGDQVRVGQRDASGRCLALPGTLPAPIELRPDRGRPDRIWAVGEHGTFLYEDGWREILGPGGERAAVTDLCATSDGSLLAIGELGALAGERDFGSLSVLAFSGTEWRATDTLRASGFFCAAPDVRWAVRGTLDPTAGGGISDLGPGGPRATYRHPRFAQPWAAYVAGPDDIWIGGLGGAERFDGREWLLVPLDRNDWSDRVVSIDGLDEHDVRLLVKHGEEAGAVEQRVVFHDGTRVTRVVPLPIEVQFDHVAALGPDETVLVGGIAVALIRGTTVELVETVSADGSGAGFLYRPLVRSATDIWSPPYRLVGSEWIRDPTYPSDARTVVERDGQIWASGHRAIFRHDGAAWHVIPVPTEYWTYLWLDPSEPDGEIWVADERGVLFVGGEVGFARVEAEGPRPGEVNAFLGGRIDDLWLFSHASRIRFDGTSLRQEPIPEGNLHFFQGHVFDVTNRAARTPDGAGFEGYVEQVLEHTEEGWRERSDLTWQEVTASYPPPGFEAPLGAAPQYAPREIGSPGPHWAFHAGIIMRRDD